MVWTKYYKEKIHYNVCCGIIQISETTNNFSGLKLITKIMILFFSAKIKTVKLRFLILFQLIATRKKLGCENNHRLPPHIKTDIFKNNFG